MNLDKQDKAELSAEIKALENACANQSTTWKSTQLAKLIKKHYQQNDPYINEDIMNLNPS
jgi:surface antigen